MKTFDQMRHIVYRPHSRLAARQPNDVISVLAGPLKLLTFILIIISIPSPPRSFIPDLKPSFSANPPSRSLPFFFRIPQTVFCYF